MIGRTRGLSGTVKVGIFDSMGDLAERLYDQVIKLPPGERRSFALRVLASVANDGESVTPSGHGRNASWKTIESLRGVVHLGGNAVEDCDQLYDG